MTGHELSVWSGRVARVIVGTGVGLFDRRLSAEIIRDQDDRAEQKSKRKKVHRVLLVLDLWVSPRGREEHT